jgi:hypothetical protein
MRSLGSGSTLLLLGNAFGNESIVLLLLFLLANQSSAVEGTEVAAPLETDRGDEPLNLGAVEC